ncbi:MAG: TolC family protein [Spirochaetales bacterium]|nr:TolC family protein [Spirochaetales bacterium]
MKYWSLLLLAILVMTTSLSGFGLSFEDVIEKIPQTTGVRSAQLALEAASAELGVLEYPGDPTVSLQPSVSAITPDGGPFAQQVSLEALVSASFPVGLSEIKAAALDNGRSAVEAAKRNLELVKQTMYVTLFNLYTAAQSAQAEKAVLELEIEAAQASENISLQLYDSGKISLVELVRVQESLKQAESALIEARLAERLRWLDLAYAADLNPLVTLALEPVSFVLPELPRPPELTEWALSRDGSILQQIDKIRQIEAEMSKAGAFDLAATLKASVNAYSHAASVAYNTENRLITGSYSFPVYTFESGDSAAETNTGNTSGSWNLGMSVALSLSGGSGNARQTTFNEVVLEQENEKLSALEDALALNIRARYQSVLLGEEAVRQAERNVEKASDFLLVISEQFGRGQVTASEVRTAQAALARAEYQLQEARVSVLKASLSVAQSASYLDEYLQTGVMK